MLHAIDPNGFVMGVLDGRPIARASALVYDDHFAFCGLYIVDPAYRGQGYGLKLTQARLEYIGNRNAGLDGIENMVEKYARLGYRTAHRSTRHTFQPKTTQHAADEIVSLAKVPFAELAAYDRRHFFASREAFLRRWIAQPGAVLRKCRAGYKIGPLFADHPDIAESLFSALSNHAIGNPVSIDIPEPNQAGMKLAARHELKGEFTCERMYLTGDPGLPLDNIYGITTFEAG